MFDLEKPSDFGPRFHGHSLRAHTVNGIWPMIAAAAITTIGGALMSGGDDGGGQIKPKILPKTVSGNSVSDMDFMYGEEATAVQDQLTGDMMAWSNDSREFFQDVVQPYQEEIIASNSVLMPDIIKNSGAALQQNIKDMAGGDQLKESFRKLTGEAGGNIGKFASNFADQVDAIPSAEQRVGQAVSGIEQQFGKAGAELKRQMGAQGLDVSQASKRDMAIQKATAKAGGAQMAAQGARQEALAANEKGIGVMGAIQESQTNMLNADRELTQAGANLTPQIGGVESGLISGDLSDAGKVAADLATSAAEKVQGTSNSSAQAEFTQKGVQTALFFDKETGQTVDAAGNVPVKPKKQQGFRSVPAYTNPLDSSGNPGSGGGNAPGGTGVGIGPGAGQGGVGMDGGGGMGAGGGGGNGAGGGAGSGVCCFVAGTQILTASGEMAIEDIGPGNEVYSYSFLNGRHIWSTVNSCIQVLRSGYYDVVFESGKVLSMTDDHPVWTDNKWQAINGKAARDNKGYDHLYDIGDLTIGSGVRIVNGEFDRVTSIDHMPGDVVTYTLSDVAPAKNFFANGYLASNKI